MTKLIFCLGLPGSGKSTYAEQLAKENDAIICSSDALREELYGSAANQEHNEEIFNILSKRMKDLLISGKSVIYDAQNINAKYRVAFLSQVKKISCKKIAVIVATPFEECLRRNNMRERHVPEYVIKRSYMNFMLPTLSEGFDEVKIKYAEGVEFKDPRAEVLKSVNLAHDNPHHTETVGNHMLLAEKYLLEHYPDASETLKIATLVHDIGKPVSKTFTNYKGDPTEVAHFYNHNRCGAYDSLFLNIPEEIKLDVALLIQYHMQYFVAWKNSNKAKEKDKKILGDKLFNELEILHICDLESEKINKKNS